MTFRAPPCKILEKNKRMSMRNYMKEIFRLPVLKPLRMKITAECDTSFN